MSVIELARELGCSRNWLYRLAQEVGITMTGAAGVGKGYRFGPEEIARLRARRLEDLERDVPRTAAALKRDREVIARLKRLSEETNQT